MFALKEALIELERIVDLTDYSQKVKLLKYMLEAYDSLIKGAKIYYYESGGDLFDGLVEELLDRPISKESEEESNKQSEEQ